MKKLMLLALVALVAGAAFAETAPAFSGTFEFYTTMDFEAKDFRAGSTEDASINLNGVVDEWSTVGAEFAITSVATEDTAAGGSASANVLGLDSFTMTTDITGALGVDGPVGVTIEWGAVYHEAAEYHGVAGFEDLDILGSTNTYLGFILTLNIVETVNLIALVSPGTYIGSGWTYGGAPDVLDAVITVEAQFISLVDGLDFNIWYGNDPQAGLDEIGLTLGYSLDAVNVGAAFFHDLGASLTGAGISAQYVMDVLTAGVSFGARDFANFDVATVGINLTYHAMDVLDIYAAAIIDFTGTFKADAGIDFFLGAVTYRLGYDYNGAGFASPDGEGMYFKVSGDF